MAVHRFCVPGDRVQGGEVRFTPEQSHQLARVLRLRAGSLVRVFDGERAADWEVELEQVALKDVRGRIVGEAPQAVEPRTRLVAYPSLLRRDKFEEVLQKLVEVGAAAIAPIHTTRTLGELGPDARRLTRWHAIVREATEQSGRGVVPSLRPPATFAVAVGDASRRGVCLLAYEREELQSVQAALTDVPPGDGEVAVFVGPEGGFAPAEVDTAQAAGARVVSLGPRILRAETASVVFATLVLAYLGDLERPPGTREG